MDLLRLPDELPDLRTPVLVAAFEGWNDAGDCATLAVDTLAEAASTTRFAEIDAEALYDLQDTRPMVRTDENGVRVIDWPEITISWARLDDPRGDLVVVRGAEPNLRWRSFSEAVVALARALDVRLVVTVGALQVDVPHTRPVPITLTSSDPTLAAELGLPTSTYEGPTGITGALHVTAGASGIPAVSLWAGVPHYLAATPYLRGGLVLAERLAGLIGADIPLAKLAREAAEQTDEIAELIAADRELGEYVAELDSRAAAAIEIGEGREPEVSADELVAELERYLRGER